MRKPKYVQEFKDRHGKIRCYFRRKGQRPVPLPGVCWTPTFMEHYEAALNNRERPAVASARTKHGTIAHVVAGYFNSGEFLNTKATTQATYRGIIERIRSEHGDRAVAELTREKVSELHARKAKTPSAANNWLRMMHLLMQHAISMGLRTDDPTLGVKPFKIRSAGFNIWSQAQIEQYRATHALGTRARLALELLYNSMQRRSDVVRMGRQHVRGGTLSLKQQKTGALIEIPLLPDAVAAIDAYPNEHMTFLVTADGSPFTAAGFGGWFRTMCDAAGIPKGYSAHGLRKAGATRLAEAGCTDHEIMSWGGWESLKEVQRYTKAANRKRMAQSAVAKLSEAK